jgi:hypothetical protein
MRFGKKVWKALPGNLCRGIDGVSKHCDVMCKYGIWQTIEQRKRKKKKSKKRERGEEK